VSDKTTAHIRTHVARADTHRQEVPILHATSGCFHAVQNLAATCFHGHRADSADSVDQELFLRFRAPSRRRA